MSDTALHLVERVLPETPPSPFPYPLRSYTSRLMRKFPTWGRSKSPRRRHDNLGRCEFDRMLEASAPDDGAWLLRCERGFRRLSMGLASATDPRFSELAGAAIHPLAAPRETALERLLADPKARVESCEHELPGSAAVRAALARLELTETACELGAVRGGDGESQSTYDLVCGGRPLVLAMRLDGGNVARARLRDAHASARCD